MPTIKAVLKNDFVKSDGKCKIYFRLYHKKLKYIPSAFFIEEKFWDNKTGKAKPAYPSASTLNKAIYRTLLEYTATIEDQGNEVKDMDIETLYNKLTGNEGPSSSFTKYTQKWIKQLSSDNRFSYAESNQVSLDHLKTFIGKDDILFKEITTDLLKRFRKHLTDRDCKVNTQRIYFNNIRTIFNNAIQSGVIKQTPFRNFEIRKEKVKKIALIIDEIRKLMIGPYFVAQQRSVRLFMLSFYLCGMNLKDLLFLPCDAIKKGYIAYKRLKIAEKQEIELKIKVVPEALEIIEMYRGEKYLLKFMDEDDSYKAYKSFLGETNKRLRFAGAYAGITKHLSTGITRHSWATIAMSLGVPTSDIDLSLGHNLNSMTGGYVNYDQLFGRVDEANKKVIEAIS